MNIVMVTNTFTPHIGGVAGSVNAFTQKFRSLGHRVLVIAPYFENTPENEIDVIRVPALQKFNGGDFSVSLPIVPGILAPLDDFQPDIVHCHHPFLLGATALRIARSRNIPLVFTHHTMYERYTHYVPVDSRELKTFVIQLSTGFANLCQEVIAPSESVKTILEARGVETPITVIPTGVDVALFRSGDGNRIRLRYHIPLDAFVVGHVGRLAPEKNLKFLSLAVQQFLRNNPSAHFLVVGNGPEKDIIGQILKKRSEKKRVHLVGPLRDENLRDSYKAMDVFVFASHTETQGMVVTEAMAAGLPVVALDAPGIREVVKDKQNGCLLQKEDIREFADAIDWVVNLNNERRESVKKVATETAQKFSLENTAQDALQLYDAVLQRFSSSIELGNDNLWSSAMRLIEAEWNIISNSTQAAGKALLYSRFKALFPIRLSRKIFHRVRRALSRGEWAVKLLKLSTKEGERDKAGLVLIQIDGLSRKELERALHQRNMPFCYKLLHKKEHQLHSIYSGLPSTTPAAQGELFYGKRMVVPAFAYYDRKRKQRVRMFEPEHAAHIEKELMKCGEGLLAEGSCYSSIYTGGAMEAHFCPARFGWGSIAANPFAIGIVLLWHGWSFVRALALLVLETIIALYDGARGAFAGEDLQNELKLIFSRISVSILLREFLVAGAVVDVTRGLPVVLVNFLGYDEQAHRRGPSSRFAHWTLKGIDDAIKRIARGSMRSHRRTYSVWIYSDHGQEHTQPYSTLQQKDIEQVVAEVVGNHRTEVDKKGRYAESAELYRSQWLGGRIWQRFFTRPPSNLSPQQDPSFEVSAMGPLGHIYFRDPLSFLKKKEIAAELVHSGRIPLVLVAYDSDAVLAFNHQGEFILPFESKSVLGSEHPFLENVTQDLIELCHHPDAGDLVICGWQPDATPVSFPQEKGAHGGPGSAETHAFVLLPRKVCLLKQKQAILCHSDLRDLALQFLGRLSEEHQSRNSLEQNETDSFMI